MTTITIAQRTARERDRQLILWGQQDHPDGTSEDNGAIADNAKLSCEIAFKQGRGTYLDILLEEVFEASAEVDEEKLKVELTQVAAVAESWIAAIERRQAARVAA